MMQFLHLACTFIIPTFAMFRTNVNYEAALFSPLKWLIFHVLLNLQHPFAANAPENAESTAAKDRSN
jgi:hypothetical protein